MPTKADASTEVVVAESAAEPPRRLNVFPARPPVTANAGVVRPLTPSVADSAAPATIVIDSMPVAAVAKAALMALPEVFPRAKRRESLAVSVANDTVIVPE